MDGGGYMKVIKTANGKNKIKIGKREWETIGRFAGWGDMEDMPDARELDRADLDAEIGSEYQLAISGEKEADIEKTLDALTAVNDLVTFEAVLSHMDTYFSKYLLKDLEAKKPLLSDEGQKVSITMKLISEEGLSDLAERFRNNNEFFESAKHGTLEDFSDQWMDDESYRSDPYGYYGLKKNEF